MKRIVPRVSTRGYYNRTDGKTLKRNRYSLYPKKAFTKLVGCKEIAVMVHGLRNDSSGAVAKTVIAKNRLWKLGYTHPVVGFSYDSNTTGAHLIKYAKRALVTGQKIAVKNGRNMSQFICDFKNSSPNTKIRLMGHSLGTQVILSAIEYLSRYTVNHGIIESVHFFGASIPSDVPSSQRYAKILDKMITKKIMNYYSPTDEILSLADAQKYIKGPLGLNGVTGKPIQKYQQRKVAPKNHRFASYAAVLPSFP